MHLALIQPPAADVITLDEAKAHLRVDFADHDEQIRQYIAAAVGLIDAAAGGWLGRGLRPQQWELRLSSFDPRGRIKIPIAPLISIDSIAYIDGAGTDQVLLEDTDFVIVGKDGKGTCYLVPAWGASWPSVRCTEESVRILFTVGYPLAVAASGDDPAIPDQLPAPIRQWLQFKIATFYQARDEVFVEGSASTALPVWVEQMISPYRIYA